MTLKEKQEKWTEEFYSYLDVVTYSVEQGYTETTHKNEARLEEWVKQNPYPKQEGDGIK